MQKESIDRLRSIRFILLCLFFFLCGCSGPSRNVTFHFPDAVDLGDLWLIEDVNCFTCGTGKAYLGKAQGTLTVTLPASHWYVQLDMPKNVSHLLPYLRDPSLRDIGSIDLSGTNVTDADLQHLSQMHLQHINLSNTTIEGSGLQFLQPHPHWIFVELFDCHGLDTHYLSHFRGWTRSTISVASGYTWRENDTQEELKILTEAKHVICDDLPEDVCGVQIR